MDLLLLLLRALTTAILYAFLGGVFLLLWRDLRRAAGGEQPPLPPPTRLVVVEAEEGVQAGETFALLPLTSLGRSADNTIPLPDPFVSARHALIVWREGRWWLEDQGSRNGTRLNGEPVSRPTVLSAGDLIGIGRVTLRVTGEQGSAKSRKVVPGQSLIKSYRSSRCITSSSRARLAE